MATIALTEEEVKNKRVAVGTSVVLHIIILILLFYIFAWRAPNPPAAETGIEINFGTDAVGSGDLQTQATPNKSERVQDSKPAPTDPEPRPEPKPQAQVTPPTPVETPKVVTQAAESPVAVKEEVKPVVKPQPKEEVKKPVEQPKEEVKKEPEPVVNKAALMGKKSENTGTGKAGTSDEAVGNNNGNDADKVGDKGIREGSLMSKNYEGKPGGGAGGLDMAGWRYDVAPKKDPYANETGFIKFRIKIDGDGNLISVDRVEGTVSPHVERFYRDELRKTTFSRTGGSGSSNSGATGYVTFVITSK